MNLRHVYVGTSIAAAAFAAFAGGQDPLTRVQVRAEVLQARAAGQLLKAGDAYPEGHAARAGTSFARTSSRVVAAQSLASFQPNGQ